MVCTIAEALAELVDALPRLDEAIRAERRRRRREREKARQQDRPRVMAATFATKE